MSDLAHAINTLTDYLTKTKEMIERQHMQITSLTCKVKVYEREYGPLTKEVMEKHAEAVVNEMNANAKA